LYWVVSLLLLWLQLVLYLDRIAKTLLQELVSSKVEVERLPALLAEEQAKVVVVMVLMCLLGGMEIANLLLLLLLEQEHVVKQALVEQVSLQEALVTNKAL
jgi:hypothetical protein